MQSHDNDFALDAPRNRFLQMPTNPDASGLTYADIQNLKMGTCRKKLSS